jgi:UDP-N-acetylglucosamine--N-acetylmuramyl-(pentapeptide) pyrophosphoryl-undecaprenol N-acetylglucosamine transferase
MALVNRSAALLVKDQDAKKTLVDEAIRLVNDKPRRQKLVENIRGMAFRDSANRIAKEVLKLANYDL